MSPRDTLLAKLRERGDLAFTTTRAGVRIEPPDPSGFSVTFVAGEDASGATVFLGEGGYHEHFDTGEEALEFVAWCYSGEARIRESWRGNLPAKVKLEAQRDGVWTECGTWGLLFTPFWRRKTERVLHNPNLMGG
jgi:hypothetical protein